MTRVYASVDEWILSLVTEFGDEMYPKECGELWARDAWNHATLFARVQQKALQAEIDNQATKIRELEDKLEYYIYYYKKFTKEEDDGALY